MGHLLLGLHLAGGPALDPTVQVAVVGGIFGLIGITVSVLVDRGKTSPPVPVPVPFTPEEDADAARLWAELVRRAEDAEHRAGECEHRLTIETARAWRYRDQLLRADIEPLDHPQPQPPHPHPGPGAPRHG